MSDPGDEPPPFENPFDGDAEQRVYGTVLGLRSPAGVSAVAERADCDPKTARKYLEWFAELGVATRHDGEPTTYERNDAYFEWRRVDRLAAEHTADALREHVQDLSTRIETYEHRYDATRPADVDAVTAASGAETTIDEVYADLGDWATAIEERRLHERARRQRVGGTRAVN
jgi:predicted transcriptional regulator